MGKDIYDTHCWYCDSDCKTCSYAHPDIYSYTREKEQKEKPGATIIGEFLNRVLNDCIGVKKK